jgi:hypothetical protein
MPADLKGDDPTQKKFSDILSQTSLPLDFRSDIGPSRPDDSDRVSAALPTELQDEIDPEATVIQQDQNHYQYSLLTGGHLLVRTSGNQIVAVTIIQGKEKLKIATPDADVE